MRTAGLVVVGALTQANQRVAKPHFDRERLEAVFGRSTVDGKVSLDQISQQLVRRIVDRLLRKENVYQ